MTQVTNNQPQKLYRFEVDQSGRIEELNRLTVIAIASQEQAYALLIPVKVKRKLFEKFRLTGKPKRFGVEAFSTAVVCVLTRASFRVHELIVDLEYPGYDQYIIQIIHHQFPEVSAHIHSIGKSSPAHEKAYFTYKQRIRPDSVLRTRDIPSFLTKKDGRRAVTPRVYTDSQPNRPVIKQDSRK